MRIRQYLPSGSWIFALSAAFSVLFNFTVLTRTGLTDWHVLHQNELFRKIYVAFELPSYHGLKAPSQSPASLEQVSQIDQPHQLIIGKLTRLLSMCDGIQLLTIAAAETSNSASTWPYLSATWKSKLYNFLSTSKPSAAGHVVILAPSDGPYFLSPLAYFIAIQTLQRNRAVSVTILADADTLHDHWSNKDTAFDARLALGSTKPEEDADVYAEYVRSGQMLVKTASRSSGSYQDTLQSLLRGSATYGPADGFIDMGASLACSGGIADAAKQHLGILSELSTALQAWSKRESHAASSSSSSTLPWLISLNTQSITSASSELKSLVRSLPGNDNPLHAVQLYIPERPLHTLYGQGSCASSFLSASVLADPSEWNAWTNSSSIRDIRQLRVQQREAMRQTARSSPILVHFALSALGDLPIHFDYDSDLDFGTSLQQTDSTRAGSSIDLLHTLDLVEAIHRTASLLQEAKSRPLKQAAVPSFFAAIDVLSPATIDIQSIAADIISMTLSRSPVGWLVTREGKLEKQTSEIDAKIRSGRVQQLKAVLGLDLQTGWQDTWQDELSQLLAAQRHWLQGIMQGGRRNDTSSLSQSGLEGAAWQYGLGTGWSGRSRLRCGSAASAEEGNDVDPSIAQLEAGLAKIFGFSGKSDSSRVSPPTEIQLITPGDRGVFGAIACNTGEDIRPPQPDDPAYVIKTKAMTYHGGPPRVIARLRQNPTTSQHSRQSSLQIQMSCIWDQEGLPIKTETFMGVQSRSNAESYHPQYTNISSAQGDSSSWLSVHFVDRASRAFALTYEEAGAGRRVLSSSSKAGLVFVPEAKEGIASQEWRADAGVLLLRPNPICDIPILPQEAELGQEEAWDFRGDDPMLISNIYYPSTYTRNSLRNATLEQQRCQEVQSAHDSLLVRQDNLRDTIVGNRSFEAAASRLSYDGRYSQWAPAQLPICKVDCEAPIPCLATKHCRCIRHSCGDARMPGLPHSSHNVSLAKQVAALPWSSVVLPGARRAFSLKTSQQPLGFVFNLSTEVDRHAEFADCTNISESWLPQLGDHYLVTEQRKKYSSSKSSLSSLSGSTMDTQDWFTLPFYQKCYAEHFRTPDGVTGLLVLAYDAAAAQIQSMTTALSLKPVVTMANATLNNRHSVLDKMVVPFVHDWSSCATWRPLVEDMTYMTKPEPMREAISWQTNGDLYSPCVTPDRDIIAPGTSKNIPAFFNSFRTMQDVRPSNERRYLGFFSGGARGYGAVARTRLACSTTSISANTRSRSIVDEPGEILINRYKPDGNYQMTLNDSKFCLLPRGLPAWTTRTFEAIYSGCIPAFVAERNLWAWSDILDYSTFSISIPETRLDQLEEILQSYDDAAVARMQTALLKVRDLFAFREAGEGGWEGDDGSDGMDGRRGPIWMTAASMALRLGLRYPIITEETPMA